VSTQIQIILWALRDLDHAFFGALLTGWPEPYKRTVYDSMNGDFPAKNTGHTPYLPIHVWFWPTLIINNRAPCQQHLEVAGQQRGVMQLPARCPEGCCITRRGTEAFCVMLVKCAVNGTEGCIWEVEQWQGHLRLRIGHVCERVCVCVCACVCVCVCVSVCV